MHSSKKYAAIFLAVAILIAMPAERAAALGISVIDDEVASVSQTIGGWLLDISNGLRSVISGINGGGENECITNKSDLSCCRDRLCRKLGADYQKITKSYALMYCDGNCQPATDTIDAWLSCEASCLQSGFENAIDCRASAANKIGSSNGIDCCCRKIDCLRENELTEPGNPKDCCDGLDKVSVDSDNGFRHMCILGGSQKAGEICDFDDDCAPGLKCESFDFEPAVCVDMGQQKDGAFCDFDDDCADGYVCISDLAEDYHECAKLSAQKDGAKCTFDDDCAVGFHCDRSGWDNTCKKTPACAKSGETIDRANEQECCPGLKMVAEPGFNYKCIIASSQKETQSCTFDSDCPDSYFCYNFYQCRQKPTCAQVGEVSDYENGKECCPGLESIANYRLESGELVLPAAAQNICTKCGDGVCNKGENSVNCATDCPAEVIPEAADNVTKYLRSTPPFGKALLQPGQCQEMNCVGSEREINGIYKCNGRIIGKIVCGNELDSNSSGYGSAEGGYVRGYLCCGAQGSSGGGVNSVSANRTSPNIKYEPLDVPAIGKCANEGETLIFFSNQKCCAGLRSIFIKQGGNPVELCIKSGAQAEGQPCDNDEDCQSGLECSYDKDVCEKITENNNNYEPPTIDYRDIPYPY